MEIRTVAVVAALMAGAGSARGATIQTYPLDERLAYTIRVSREEPTTCLFPGPLTALEGGNLSTKAEDAPAVLLSHQAGASFFSVRALKYEARAAVNVVYRGRVFVLTFAAADEADRAVSFLDAPTLATPSAKPLAVDVLRSLLDRAKHHDLLAEQYPALARTVARARPHTLTRYPGFIVMLVEVFRFETEDVLVFGVRAENPGDGVVRFDPSGLGVRVGPIIYPATLAEATGEIPPHATTAIWFAVAGDGRGGRANLSVHNTFSVLVPTKS